MNTRLEAAAEAIQSAACGQELPEAPIDLAREALESADAVMFSPESIERAARQMMREGHGWILPEGIMAIRAVVAALKDAAA